ncbi:hypothetical protein PUR34_15155 [Streptomyces sp. JV185]|uniref:hypothetical protein n=1 Tax=Streptomyces sp. JV185 TaxID=858638 RepID=UPI002E79B240|nr:hypothetical protein [Streptomyces sp. JV185]MEE1769447.1 hypothetical protein [Streptomyces sp. JV185]
MRPVGDVPLRDGVERLAGHDLVVVTGGEVFRYCPCVPGTCLPAGTSLLQITGDPRVATAARMGDSLLGETEIAICQCLEPVAEGSALSTPTPR